MLISRLMELIETHVSSRNLGSSRTRLLQWRRNFWAEIEVTAETPRSGHCEN